MSQDHRTHFKIQFPDSNYLHKINHPMIYKTQYLNLKFRIPWIKSSQVLNHDEWPHVHEYHEVYLTSDLLSVKVWVNLFQETFLCNFEISCLCRFKSFKRVLSIFDQYSALVFPWSGLDNYIPFHTNKFRAHL